MPRKFRNFGMDTAPGVEQGASMAFVTNKYRFGRLPSYMSHWLVNTDPDVMVPLKAKGKAT